MSSPSRTGLYKIDLYFCLFHRMGLLHFMLPARRVMTRLLSFYYKQELVWNWRQWWGGVDQDCVCDIEQCTCTIKLPCILLLGVEVWEGVFTQTFVLSLAYHRHSNYASLKK